jgi:hypothetical protein
LEMQRLFGEAVLKNAYSLRNALILEGWSWT